MSFIYIKSSCETDEKKWETSKSSYIKKNHVCLQSHSSETHECTLFDYTDSLQLGDVRQWQVRHVQQALLAFYSSKYINKQLNNYSMP